MTVLALDQSKRSCGWAVLDGETARYGTWTLGSEYTSDGRVFMKLHQSISDLYSVHKFEHVVFEEPLTAMQLQGHTNIDTLRVLAGLAAHICSWAEAMGMRTVRSVNQTTWRKHFIGSQKRGTKRDTLKQLSMARCRDLGFAPRNDDEADALGLLDYGCMALDISAPWRKSEVLV